MRILGIETSCDETAAAVVARNASGEAEILSSIILGQIREHAAFGGVVPELAARAHLAHLDSVVKAALIDADCTMEDIDAIAATAGPGLIGGLVVGLMFAKGLAASSRKPLIAVNHLEGHALTARLMANIDYPYLLLLVSGGHTQILCVRSFGNYERWATTIDDALGEAFDKTAKLLSLGFPGGPAVEQAAIGGDASRFTLPFPLQGRDTLNFSFSGLKTAIRLKAQELEPLSSADVSDLCAAFQDTVSRVLCDRANRAMARFEETERTGSQRVLVAAGGVAANARIRSSLTHICDERGWHFLAPPLELCGDNAAMIAWAGLENRMNGKTSDLDVAARSRWPLDQDAEPLVGSGRRGAKA
ncbi:MAG: tRNA (adenosine(37)-N6)-threonylcarbamoyltransferase complex transferase subunit TsaD [Rhizobiaceae bacterium]